MAIHWPWSWSLEGSSKTAGRLARAKDIGGFVAGTGMMKLARLDIQNADESRNEHHARVVARDFRVGDLLQPIERHVGAQRVASGQLGEDRGKRLLGRCIGALVVGRLVGLGKSGVERAEQAVARRGELRR